MVILASTQAQHRRNADQPHPSPIDSIDYYPPNPRRPNPHYPPCPCGGMITASAVLPLRTHASAPLVTKLKSLFRLFPPKRLCRKLGKAQRHSPVFCGTIERVWDSEDVGEPRGVREDVDVSLRLDREHLFVRGTSRSGVGVKSNVNYIP